LREGGRERERGREGGERERETDREKRSSVYAYAEAPRAHIWVQV